MDTNWSYTLCCRCYVSMSGQFNTCNIPWHTSSCTVRSDMHYAGLRASVCAQYPFDDDYSANLMAHGSSNIATSKMGSLVTALGAGSGHQWKF